MHLQDKFLSKILTFAALKTALVFENGNVKKNDFREFFKKKMILLIIGMKKLAFRNLNI